MFIQYSLLIHKVITFNNFPIILNLCAPPNFLRRHPDVLKELECFFSANSKVLFIVLRRLGALELQLQPVRDQSNKLTVGGHGYHYFSPLR